MFATLSFELALVSIRPFRATQPKSLVLSRCFLHIKVCSRFNNFKSFGFAQFGSPKTRAKGKYPFE